MRLFLALPLSDFATSALGALQDDLKIGRAVDEDNMHVTLAFLGDVTMSEAEELHERLEALRLPAVALRIEGIGHFGRAAPRLVWAGIRPDPVLQALAAKVTNAARQSGIAVAHRRFVPHVTLARLRERADDAGPVAAFAARHARLSLPEEAPRVMGLYQSHLRPEGPVYELLADYPLGDHPPGDHPLG